MDTEAMLPVCTTFVGQEESAQIDAELLGLYTLDQLMELAGLSVAHVVEHLIDKDSPDTKSTAVAVLAGPGNNGGDALVAARHLAGYGRRVVVYAPRVPPRLAHLVRQAAAHGVRVCETLGDVGVLSEYAAVVDGVFGFGAVGAPRPPFDNVVAAMVGLGNVVSIDVPSGWPVDAGGPEKGAIMPRAIVSLTAPKMGICRMHDAGGESLRHFLAGRFVPESIAESHRLDRNPPFVGTALFVETRL